ncbi:unnamed protein product [Alopecurus aequalis]
MHMAAAADQGKTTTSWTRFRWLYVARCTVAFVVTVLAVAVIARAVVVMLRPEKLELKLSGGHVAVDYITSLPPPGNVVKLTFVLRANNPSGRASVEYTNITARFTYALSSPAPTQIAEFDLTQPILVSQRTARESIVTVTLTPKEDLPIRYVRAFFEGRVVAGAQLELRGVFVTMASGDVTTTTNIVATYYCWPHAVVDTSSSSAPGKNYGSVPDAPCLDKSEAPAIV